MLVVTRCDTHVVLVRHWQPTVGCHGDVVGQPVVRVHRISLHARVTVRRLQLNIKKYRYINYHAFSCNVLYTTAGRALGKESEVEGSEKEQRGREYL